MFLSYIFSVNGSEMAKVKATIQTIEAQSDNDFEFVLLSDMTENDEEVNDYLRDYFWSHDNCKLIENSSLQGVAVSWNTGIEVAEGKYLSFVNSEDEMNPKFIATLKAAIADKGDIDLIEYYVHLSGMADSVTKTYIEKDKVFNLRQSKEPFAYINDLIYSKIFRNQVVQDYSFKFRRFVRYDMLFIYKFLGQAETYMFLDGEPLVNTKIRETNYSIFDLVNQWPHILNYYRRIGKYRELKDYLNYAYYKILVHTWFWWIKKYQNKLLMKKAVAFAQRKFEDKRENFMKNNEIFKQKRDAKFVNIVEDFNKWMKDLQKAVK